MIQANELRIGNYLIDQYGDIGKVVGLNSDKEYKHNGQLFVGTATLYYDNYKGFIGRWIQTLKPIILTEEILLKCGFEDISTYKDFRLVINEDLYIEVSLRKNINAYVSISDIDIINVIYVHQLQNLYFALTGKELEIKF